MNQDHAKKIAIVKIWEILSKETDENHPMPSKLLLEKLKSDGIEINRNTLYSNISLLNEFGYEILCHRGVSNEYYVVDRSFDNPEVQILMDAVQAASSHRWQQLWQDR